MAEFHSDELRASYIKGLLHELEGALRVRNSEHAALVNAELDRVGHDGERPTLEAAPAEPALTDEQKAALVAQAQTPAAGAEKR